MLIANLLAWPFAYFAGKAHLNVFVDPIPLTLWPFVTALAVSLLISWIAVGGLQMLRLSKSCVMNKVD